MADVTAFDTWPGETSGRVVDHLGRAAFVLGSTAHAAHLVADGDYDEAVQEVAVDAGVRLVRVRLDVAGPAPDDASWTVEARADDAARVVLPVWRKPWTRELSDVALPVLPGTGRLTLGLRLSASTPGGVECSAALPAVTVRELVEATDLARPTLINRSPEPGETGVPRGSHVVVEVYDPEGPLADLLAGAFTVSVGGHAAWSAGAGFAPGWDGPASQVVELDDGHTWRITVDRTTPYASLERVSVEVLFDGDTPETSLSSAYEFQVEDATAPRLLQVDAVAHDVFRARFSEPVVQGDGGGAADAFVAANWAISLASTSLDDGLPALQVACASVRPVAGSAAQVDLVLDREATSGARYLVVVSGVEDLFGNVVDPAHDSAVVVGYGCAPVEGRRFDLRRWLPQMNVALDHPRRGGTRDLEALLKVWQHVFDRVLCDVDRFPEVFDPDRAPEPFVDAMLADFGVSPYGGDRRVPFARFGLDLTQKRRLLRAALALYKQKGTSDGIAAAARLLLGVEVRTSTPAMEGVWVLGESVLGVDTKLGTDDAALLYSFYVVSQGALTDEERYWVREFALYARPSHTHLLGIVAPAAGAPSEYWVLGVSQLGVDTVPGPEPP
jgi:phage tail-like protein